MIEHVFYQGSLLGVLPARFDRSFAGVERRQLDDSTWVDWAPHWLSGADDLFDELVDTLPWRQRKGVPMYDHLVDEPRLTAWCRTGDEPVQILADMRDVLA